MSGWTYSDNAWQRGAQADDDVRPAAAPASAQHAAGLGSVIANRYVLKSYLGKGRYGEVYMAVDRSLSDPALAQEYSVALHLLYPHLTQQPHLLQKLETTYHQPHLWSHPNVVKVRGFGADHGRYFLVTELLAGVSLRSVLDESPEELLSETEVFAVLRGIGDALKYAHAKGTIHGDIRPEKVFITEDYAVKVLDLLPIIPPRTVPFFVEDTADGAVATPDQRDDVYGLACITYELLSGRHPFNGNSPLEALTAGLMLAPIPGISTARWNALTRALALRREHRTASVAAFLGELGVTGDENLRVGSRRGDNVQLGAVPSAQRTTARNVHPMHVEDDDVPVIHEPTVVRAAPPPPVRPVPQPEPPPLPTRRMPAQTGRGRHADDFDVYPERVDRRARARSGRGRGLLLAAVGAGIAALAVFAYSNREDVAAAAESGLAAARAFVADASRSSAERPPPAVAEENAAQENVPVDPFVQQSPFADETQSGAAPPAGDAPPAEGATAAGDANRPAANAVPPANETAPPGPTTAPAPAPTVAEAAPPSPLRAAEADPDATLEVDEPAVAGVAAPLAHEAGAEPPAARDDVSARAAVPPANERAAPPTAGAGAAPSAREPAATPPPASAESGASAAAAAGPAVVEFTARTLTVSEAEPAAVITIRRRGGGLAESSVAWWTSEGTARADDDYANLGARIETFAAGETTRTIFVPLVRDSLVEGRETFYVNLRDSERAGSRAEPASRIEVVIRDDD